MPSVSKAQHNAMEAAAHGKSTLGIPKKVGQDFAEADKGKKFPAKALSAAIARRKKHREPDADDRGGPSDHDEDNG